MDDMELKKRQEDDLEKRIRINKINVEYRKKRRKGYLFMLTEFLVLFILSMLGICFDWSMIIFGLLFFVYVVVFLITAYICMSCPHCGGYNKYAGKHCSHCGTSLEISEILIHIDEKRQSEKQNDKI